MFDDLELLREIFKDTRLHIGIGTVQKLGLSLSGGTLRLLVNLLPENRQIIAEMTWPDVCTVTFPELNDLVLVAFVEGHEDQAFVFKLLTTDEELIPVFAQAGHSVFYSRPTKKAYYGSLVKAGFGRPAVEPTEPFVLGNQAVAFLNGVLNAFLNAPQIGWHPLGPVFLDPGIRTLLLQLQLQYLTTASTNILSQICFTERGV